MKLNDIIGAVVTGVKIDASKEFMRVDTDKGAFDFVAVGDCCSNSWFEHLNGVSNIIGGKVTEVPKLHVDGVDVSSKEDKEYNVVEQYITQLKTDKGVLDIEFRNNSNGYYSGWLTLGEGQYGDPVETPKLTETGDF